MFYAIRRFFSTKVPTKAKMTALRDQLRAGFERRGVSRRDAIDKANRICRKKFGIRWWKP